MKNKINPLVDCVFKALLGSEQNKNLLIHFLNAVTGFKGDEAITDVVIMNPYNERKFMGAKLSIVDIKAKCQNKFKYQIEIQLAVHTALSNRIMYTWSSIYHSQIKKSEHYRKLKPVVSIWILDQPIFPDTKAYHLKFRPYDEENKLCLTNHMTIHLLQLSMFDKQSKITSEKERWLSFFKGAEDQDFDKLPEAFQTKEMKQAMETLKDFSQNQKRFMLYHSRMDVQLELNTWKSMLKEADMDLKAAGRNLKDAYMGWDNECREKKKVLGEKEKERKEKEKALQEKEKERKEKEKYLKILRENGINIDSL